MAIIKSFSPFQNLSNFNVFLEDNDPNSEYFRITEFQETFTGGKNGFLIEGSEFLKPTTEVKLELLDVEENPIFFIPGEGIPEYYEGVSKLVSVHVYEDTPIGQGKITILGELERYIDDQGIERDVPDEWKGVYNVKWERTFRVNKNLNNETIVRFVNRPQVQIDEVIKPFFVKDIPQITQTGSASGVGENPVEGTNLDGYTAGTLYRIAITDDSNFTASIDENLITFPNLGYSSTVREVLNNKEVLVDVPYTENNIVTNFQNQSYTTTFEDLESQSTTESALTGSFAKVKLSRLKTFVGDVARVKVFRKSRNEVGDFQLVQDARIESTELLRDITVQDDTEVFYGNFTQNILDTYWVSGSDDHPISLDDTKLFGGIQVDYNEGIGGTQTLITSESFQIEDDVEYTVSFKTIFDGTPTTDKFVRVSLSGSNYEQVISTTIPSASFNTRQNITQNFIATTSSLDTKLQFEFVGADWYVSKVSLKNAQETSFSPDELTLIQDVPRRLPQETFDFRFEFYDVNNNFIPVSVTATKEFVGGNDFRTEQKLFTFESDRTAFRFITGSLGNPSFQQIRFSNTIQNLTGSVLYTSQAFDIDGNLITSESYHDSGVLEYPGGFSGSYPGLLLNTGNDGATLPIANFSGSVSGVTVGSIIYTASLENRQEFETIFRFEDGEDAPALIVTSNTNQFIYEPTQLRPKPLGQEVRIKAQRKNLASLITPITVNSGSGNPPLTEGVDINGIKNYSISANTFSASFAGSDGAFPDVTYEFTSSDEFNNEFTDEITVSPVINFDGLSVVLSNETTAFRANSQGSVLDDFASGDGEVEVRIGENVIEHSEGLGSRNKFDIISVTGSNVTPKSTAPTTNEYGIIEFTGDSGSLVLDIRYLAGDNATSQSFTKKVNYTKNRISPPSILIDTENKNQNRDANSTGQQLTDFTNSDVTIRQIYTGSVKTFGGGDISFTITSGSNDKNGNPLVSVTGTTLSFGKLPDGTDSTTVQIEASLTDSEGGSRTVQDSISLSKSKKAPPNVLVTATPQSQTIQSGSSGYQTPETIIVSVKEGSTSFSIGSGNQQFTVGSPTGPFSVVNNTITVNTTLTETTSGTALVSYKNSEGTSDSETINFSVGVAREGNDGTPGAPGPSGSQGEPGPSGSQGEPGATGPGLTYVGECTQLDSSFVWANDGDIRNVTSVSGTFYITLPAANNQSKSTTGCPPNATYFDALSSFDSVATDIFLAKDATITRNLTIGTFGTDQGIIRSANATAVDTGKGLWLDNNGDVRFGDPSNKFVKWDNSAGTLTIKGTLDGTDGTFSGTLAAGTILSNGSIQGGTISIGSGSPPPFSVTSAGALTATNATITGDVTATNLTATNSGNIGGWTINSNSLTGGIVTLNPAGSINVGSTFNVAADTFEFGDYSIRNDILGTPVDGSFTLLYNPEIPGTNGVPLRSSLFHIVDFNSNSVAKKTGFYIESTGRGPAGDNLTKSRNPTPIQIIPKRWNTGLTGDNNNWYIYQSLAFHIDDAHQSANAYWQVNGPLKVGGNPNSPSGDITATGNITAFASSDKRLKDNIIPITSSLDKINKLNGYEFEWNDKQKSFEGKDIGLIAQEVQEVLPMLVGEQDTGYLGVRYEKLVPLLVQGIKELHDKVKELETKLNER